MGNNKMKREMKIDVHYDSVFFLKWLVEERDFSAFDITEVCFTPHKYEDLWNEYNKYADKKEDELMEELKNEKSI